MDWQEISDRERRRANHALAFLLEDYPPADQVPAREYKRYDRNKPTAKDLIEAKRTLKIDIERYEDLRARGGNAVSDYDLTISSSNDGPAALDMALSLKVAHISWHRGEIAFLERGGSDEPDLFSERTA